MQRLEKEDYIRRFVEAIHDEENQKTQRFALWTLGQIF
jgi:hypothetical protein